MGVMCSNTIPFALVGIALLTGCAHTARIASEPPGAELFVDGVQVGVTPFAIEDEVGSGQRYEIVLKKPGYRIVQTTLVQDQFAWPRGIAALACGVCTLGAGCLGLLWSWQLQDSYSFVLESISAEGSPTTRAAEEEIPVDAAPPPTEVAL